MPAVKTVTIPIAQLSQTAMALRDEGFNKFKFHIFPQNKKYVVLSAWRGKVKETQIIPIEESER